MHRRWVCNQMTRTVMCGVFTQHLSNSFAFHVRVVMFAALFEFELPFAAASILDEFFLAHADLVGRVRSNGH